MSGKSRRKKKRHKLDKLRMQSPAIAQVADPQPATFLSIPWSTLPGDLPAVDTRAAHPGRCEKTLAHRMLEIDNEIGYYKVQPSHYQILDELLCDAAQKFSAETAKDPILVLSRIGEMIRARGLTARSPKGILVQLVWDRPIMLDSFEAGSLACQGLSVLYLSVAQVVGLPLSIVDASGERARHVTIRWDSPDGSSIYWDATVPCQFEAKDMIKATAIPLERIERGMHLKPKTEEQVIAGIWFNRGNHFIRMRQYEKAIRCFRESEALDTVDHNPVINIAWCLGEQQRFDEAYRVLLARRSMSYLPAEYFFKLGWIQSRLADGCASQSARYLQLKHEAIESYLDAVRLNNDHAAATIDCGLAYSQIGDCRQALSMLTRAIELTNPENVRSRIQKEATSFENIIVGEYESAELINALTNHIDALYKRGWVYQSIGNLRDRDEDWRRHDFLKQAIQG